jgi:hypothetical protein
LHTSIAKAPGCCSAGELGDAGDLLDEIYHSDTEAAAGGDTSKEAVAEKVKAHVEPEGAAAAGKDRDTGEDPIPVTPAVEGKLV